MRARRLVLLAVKICVVVLALRQVATSQELPAVVIEKCLASNSAAKPDANGVIAVPIEKLFVGGRTAGTAEMLCIVHGPSANDEIEWFRINPATRNIAKVHSGIEVMEVLPSPNGKYLAVAEYREGILTIDVVDLPALIRDNKHASIDQISSYPGSASIKEWKGDELVVTSNTLLSRLELAGLRLDLFSTNEERFSWNLATGAVVALSASLRDPVQYYCAKLADVYDQRSRSNLYGERAFIAEALTSLRDKSGVPCIERALTIETDELIRTDIRASLDKLTQVAAWQKDCLSGSVDELKAKGIVAEPVTTLFIEGRPEAIDNVLCVANPVKDDQTPRGWLRIDRTAPDAAEVVEGLDETVEQMRVSPNGKYLAVQSRYVDVVDLPRLLTTKRYKSIHRLDGAIKEWNGGKLEVTSDVLLSHAPVHVGDEDHLLPLLSKESFIWNSENGTVTPVWNALHQPLRYYCEGLSAAEVDKRRIATRGLRLHNDKDAASCVQAALGAEPDESLQRDLRALLDVLQQR